MAEVFEGDDGFLFVASDGNNYLSQLMGQTKIPLPDFDRIITSHLSRYLFCRQLGISYVWAVVPGKERVLSDKMPVAKRNAIAAATSPVKQLIGRVVERDLHCSFKSFFLDLSASFEDFTPKEGLFHRTDTHWTHTGALLAYQYLLHFLSDPILGPITTRPKSSDAQQQGDLGRMLGRGPEKIRYLAHPNYGCSRVFDNGVENNGRVEIYQGKHPDRPTAIVLRSSSFDYMKEFFLSHFSRVVLLFSPDISYDFILNERPNYIFHLQQERYLMRPPGDNFSCFLSDSIEKKLASGAFKHKLSHFISDGGYFIRSASALETLELFCSRRI